jgi:hypothetical protein
MNLYIYICSDFVIFYSVTGHFYYNLYYNYPSSEYTFTRYHTSIIICQLRNFFQLDWTYTVKFTDRFYQHCCKCLPNQEVFLSVGNKVILRTSTHIIDCSMNTTIIRHPEQYYVDEVKDNFFLKSSHLLEFYISYINKQFYLQALR